MRLIALTLALGLLLAACGGDGGRVLILDDWQGTEQEWRLEIRTMLTDIPKNAEDGIIDGDALQEWIADWCLELMASDEILDATTADGRRAAAIFAEECARIKS